MAYRIDFTESRYAWRRACVMALLVLVLAVGAALGWGGRHVYLQWERPTLGHNLQMIHELAARIEPLYDHWQECANAFAAVAPFYRLFWSANAVDMLEIIAGRQASLPPKLTPVRWVLNTGGACELTYTLHLEPRGRREQLDNARDSLVLLTRPVEAQVTWPEQPLANVQDLKFTVTFSLDQPACATLPAPPPILKRAIERIDVTRKAVHAYPLGGGRGAADVRVVRGELDQIVQQALAGQPERLEQWRKRLAAAVDPHSFLRNLERELLGHDEHAPPGLVAFREEWHRLASRQLPWRRLKPLDSPNLSGDADALKALASDAPSPAMFDAILGRVRLLQSALRKGYQAGAVFDEGELHRRFAHECLDLSSAVRQLTIQSAPANNGVIVAPWTLTIRPPAGGDAVELTDLLIVLKRIRGMQAGFIVERVDVQLQEKGTQGKTGVRNASAAGVLAVCEGQTEANDMAVAERAGNVGR